MRQLRSCQFHLFSKLSLVLSFLLFSSGCMPIGFKHTQFLITVIWVEGPQQLQLRLGDVTQQMAYRAKSCLTLTFPRDSLLRKLPQHPHARLALQPENRLGSLQIQSKELTLHLLLSLSGTISFLQAGFFPLSYT